MRDWEVICREYVEGSASTRVLAETYGIPYPTLRDVCRRENWVKLRREWRATKGGERNTAEAAVETEHETRRELKRSVETQYEVRNLGRPWLSMPFLRARGIRGAIPLPGYPFGRRVVEDFDIARRYIWPQVFVKRIVPSSEDLNRLSTGELRRLCRIEELAGFGVRRMLLKRLGDAAVLNSRPELQSRGRKDERQRE